MSDVKSESYRIGEERMARLTKALLKEDRYTDLLVATTDRECRHALFEEFGIPTGEPKLK
jgi:hypothetical protein